jgi:uncharacterized tellurite resistance protein B-like protein
MFEGLTKFLRDLAGGEATRSFDLDDPRLAVAALLLHVIRVDGAVDAVERKTIERTLAEQFGLDASAIERLLVEADAEDREAVGLDGFTSRLARRLDPAQRIDVVKALWEAVLADGALHEMEDATVWRIGDMLELDRPALAAARASVEDRIRKIP